VRRWGPGGRAKGASRRRAPEEVAGSGRAIEQEDKGRGRVAQPAEPQVQQKTKRGRDEDTGEATEKRGKGGATISQPGGTSSGKRGAATRSRKWEPLSDEGAKRGTEEQTRGRRRRESQYTGGATGRMKRKRQLPRKTEPRKPARHGPGGKEGSGKAPQEDRY